LDQVTVETPPASEAVPLTDALAVAVLNDVGLVGVTVGATESSVTTSVSVEVLPAVSDAVTVIVFVPATSGTDAVHDAVPVAAPKVAPSTLTQVTEPTPTLSVAVPPMVRGEELVTNVFPDVGVPNVIEGGTESCRTVIVSIAVFPELSVAVTVIRLSPAARVMAGVVQEAVPVAAPLRPFAAFAQDTEATETLSVDVPPRITDAPDVMRVGSAVGVVMVTVGTTTSNVTAIESTEVFPAVSVAVTVIVFTPLVRGIEADQVPAPSVAEPEPPVAPFDQATPATPTASEVVPPIRIGAEFVS
jgi:hypothetical protein